MKLISRALVFCNSQRKWVGDLFTGLAGLAMPLGFAPYEWRLIPFISLTVLILLLQDQTALRAARRGFLFGLGMFGLGVSWVYNSLYDFGSASVIVAGFIAAILVLIMAGYVAMAAFVTRRWFAKSSAPELLLVFPALWVLIEWLRGWLFTGFPWLLLGYSQVDTWLAAYAPVGGALLVSFIVCVVASALAFILMASTTQRRMLGAAIIIASLLAGYLLKNINWVRPAGEPVSVALIQAAIPQNIKMQPGSLGSSLQRYVGLTESYLDRDLVVWPETAIHARSFRVKNFLDQFESQLTANETELLTGIFVHDFELNRYYNSLIKLGDGSRATYHKQRLVPFGEYMPFRSILEFARKYINIPMSDIAAADDVSPMTLVGHQAALGICYESAYPDVYRRQLPESAFMINVSNDAWFGDSLAPHQHLEIARMRALEAARYLLRATNSGISAIIDQDAKVILQSKQFTEDVLVSSIIPLKGETWFVKLGNWPVLVLCIGCLLLSQFLFKRQDLNKVQ